MIISRRIKDITMKFGICSASDLIYALFKQQCNRAITTRVNEEKTLKNFD